MRNQFLFAVLLCSLSTDLFGQSAHDQAVVIYKAGLKQFLADKDTAKAKQVLGAALAVDPDYAQAHYTLGILAESNKDWVSAKTEFSVYLQLAPQAPNCAMVKAELDRLEQLIQAAPKEAYAAALQKANDVYQKKDYAGSLNLAFEAVWLEGSRWEGDSLEASACSSL